MADIEIVFPAAAEEPAVADGLRVLTQLIAAKGGEISAGVLGGEFGYGAEFSNDVFEMHPYWWGDCECGYEELELAWEEAHPHTDACYQSELERRGGYQHSEALAAEWGLSDFGCAVHCTCGVQQAYETWLKEHDHDPTCGVVRPNFRHKSSSSEVRWYKYIGRGMELDIKIPWAQIIPECVSSLG